MGLVDGDNDIMGGGTLDTGDALSMEMKDCMARLCDSESRIDSIYGELYAIRTDMELGPRVAALVEQLKEVAPKVINQEHSIMDLHEKIGRMDVHGRLAAASVGHEIVGFSDSGGLA